MDYIIKYLTNILNIYDTNPIIPNNIYICDIMITNNIIDGRGIIIGDYILTLSHIIDTTDIIYVNMIKYKNILNIDFYDICVFIKDEIFNNNYNSNNNYIHKFLIDFNILKRNNNISRW